MSHFYPHPTANQLLPSVTTILEATMPLEKRAALDLYYSKGLKSYQANLDAQQRGSQVDAWAKAYLRGEPLPEVWYRFQACCDRLQPLLDFLKSATFHWIERAVTLSDGTVTHPVYDLARGYAGEPDWIVHYEGTLTICDLKTRGYNINPDSIHNAALQGTGYKEAYEAEYQKEVGAIAIITVTPYQQQIARFTGDQLTALSQEWAQRLQAYGLVSHVS